MDKLPMVKEILVQSVKKPVTNLFPATRLPKSITEFLGAVEDGRAKITPPVFVPKNFRGKISYDRFVCNGCLLCQKVCPAHAIETVEYPPVSFTVTSEDGTVTEKVKKEKRIRIYVASCIFCGQCIDICSKDALFMSDEFLLATEDRFSETQIVE